MNATIVVPFRSDEPERLRVYEFVLERWSALHPELPLVTPHDDRTVGPFCRSKAVNRGVSMADTEAVIVADADIAVRHRQVDHMLNLLSDAPWVVGYTLFQQIRPADTERLLEGDPAVPLPTQHRPRWQSASSVCGLFAIRRGDFEQIGGFDERFTGWGFEDTSFGFAADTLLGPHWRVPLACTHLYHPQRSDRKTDLDAQRNIVLEAEYRQAKGDPDAMTAVVRQHLAER